MLSGTAHATGVPVAPENRVLSVAPVIIRADLAPGEQVVRTLSVANQLGRPAVITIRPAAMRPSSATTGLDTAVDPTQAPNGFGVRILGDQRRAMAAGEKQQVRVQIDTSGSKPGGYAGALLIAAEPTGRGNLALQTQVEVALIVDVAGEARRSIQVELHRIPRLWLRDSERVARIELANTGDTNERIDVRVRIQRLLGRDERYLLPDATFLPGSRRVVPVNLARGGVPDLITIRASAQPHKTVGADDQKAVTFSTHKRVLILPLWFVVGMTVLGLVIGLRARSLRRPAWDDEFEPEER